LYSDHFQIASLDALPSKNRQTMFLKVTVKVS